MQHDLENQKDRSSRGGMEGRARATTARKLGCHGATQNQNLLCTMCQEKWGKKMSKSRVDN